MWRGLVFQKYSHVYNVIRLVDLLTIQQERIKIFLGCRDEKIITLQHKGGGGEKTTHKEYGNKGEVGHPVLRE